MPVNPMQRRIKNSFLLGFLLAVIIMALVVALLISKMKSMQKETEEMISTQKMLYVAAEDLKSGQSVTMDSFVKEYVQSSVDQSQIISEDDFSFFNEDGEIEIKYNKDGSERPKKMIMKINVPAGTIVTKDMVVEDVSEISDDQRVQEFNMIVLPSELETEDYIDIRLSLPKGQDYIVLAKKKVLKSTETGIWIKLSEEEILTMNNAIVESYTIPGSKLYANIIPEPGLQEALQPTYPVSAEVLHLIQSNPNVIADAKNALYNRYIANDQAQAIQRNTVIAPAIAENAASMTSNVESKNQEEISKIREQRAAYVSSLGE